MSKRLLSASHERAWFRSVDGWSISGVNFSCLTFFSSLLFSVVSARLALIFGTPDFISPWRLYENRQAEALLGWFLQCMTAFWFLSLLPRGICVHGFITVYLAVVDVTRI